MSHRHNRTLWELVLIKWASASKTTSCSRASDLQKVPRIYIVTAWYMIRARATWKSWCLIRYSWSLVRRKQARIWLWPTMIKVGLMRWMMRKSKVWVRKLPRPRNKMLSNKGNSKPILCKSRVYLMALLQQKDYVRRKTPTRPKIRHSKISALGPCSQGQSQWQPVPVVKDCRRLRAPSKRKLHQ